MFAVLRIENSIQAPQLRVLRITGDQDVATEHAYQCALDTFDTSDNIDVLDAADVHIDLPDFCTGFGAYRPRRESNEGIVFVVVGVVRKRKTSDLVLF